MNDRDESCALPSLFYRDPAEAVDEIRRLREVAKRKADQTRKNKSRRIQALVKLAMKGVRR